LVKTSKGFLTKTKQMRVVSLNVGLPRNVEWQGETIRTGIFKDAVASPLALRRLNFDGDRQADLTVHGGRDKAVYAYPSEHYATWEKAVNRKLPPGAFGENLTTEGLLEAEVHIGDEFRIGTARLVVTQPRMPCYKLGIRFGDPRVIKAFHQSGWPGIYFAVLEEGIVAPGDAIEQVHSDERQITVSRMNALMFDQDPPVDELRRLLEVPNLAAVWREEFEFRLAGATE
jgi:MOSC domain-containing protein YiiM